MSIVRKTIAVTEQQNDWITQQVRAGHFTNDSELLRDLIRREQERQEGLEAIRAALIAGEESGEAITIDPQRFIAEKREKYGSE